MATTLQSIITDARVQLNEPVANFWQDSELLGYLNRGIKDVRRHINQTHQNYVFQIDTAVSAAAGDTELANVPTDLGKVLLLEPADLNDTPLNVVHRRWQHSDFQSARHIEAQDPSHARDLFYTVTGIGAPGGTAPVIRIAPALTRAVTFHLAYEPVPANLTLTDNVPIPGDADQALIEWVCAYALGRERGDSTPDAKRLQNYNGEVAKILVAIAPRDESEPEVVEGMFEGGYW